MNAAGTVLAPVDSGQRVDARCQQTYTRLYATEECRAFGGILEGNMVAVGRHDGGGGFFQQVALGGRAVEELVGVGDVL